CVAKERGMANCRVRAAGCVELERVNADRRVCAASCVELERVNTDRRVENACIVHERILTQYRLLLVKQPSWQTARACGASAKEASTDRMSSKATWQDERFLKFFNGRVVVFI